MLIAQILKGKGAEVFTARPEQTVAEIAAELNRRRIGAAVVCDGDLHVVGIVSERDIVRGVAEGGASALTTPVSAIMTRDVIYAHMNETVNDLLGRMTDRRIRHLPVCIDDRLAGIVSIGDLVKSKIAEVEAEARSLQTYIAAG